jgi:hypothetical protein
VLPAFKDACVPGKNECDAKDYCTPSGHCMDDTSRLGGACGPGDHPRTCVGDTACNPAVSVCEAARKPGEACGDGPDLLCGFDSSARCDPATKTCVICLQ